MNLGPTYQYVGAVLAVLPATAPAEPQVPMELLRLNLELNSQRGLPSISRQDGILMETLQAYAPLAAGLLTRLWGFTSSCHHQQPRVLRIRRFPSWPAGGHPPHLPCPTHGCSATLVPGSRWSLEWPPSKGEEESPPPHWRTAGSDWSLLRCFRDSQGRLSGAMYGPREEGPAQTPDNSSFIQALRADFPGLGAPAATSLLQAYRCTSPADCAGAGGHRCALMAHAEFPTDLVPLLSLMGISVDLFCSALSRGAIAPPIQQWFSARADDQLVGAVGDALEESFSWAGLRAVLFPPLHFADRELSLVADKVARALAERPEDSYFIYFGPWPLARPFTLGLAGARVTLLGNHSKPRLSVPDPTSMRGTLREMRACGIWLMRAGGIRVPPPAPWPAIVEGVSAWRGCKIGEPALRLLRATNQQAEAAAKRTENHRRSTAMRAIYALVEAAEGCSTAHPYEKRSLEGRLLTLLRTELRTRPAGAPRDDVFGIPYDLGDYFQFLCHPARRGSQFQTFHPSQFQSDDGERQWINFFGMCNPPFWTHHTQPSRRLLETHAGPRAWMVIAHRPGDLISKILGITRASHGERHSVNGPPWQARDELTALFRCDVPRCVEACVLFDVGASDFALHLMSPVGVQPVTPKGESALLSNGATLRLVPWETVFRLYVPPEGLPGPTSRHCDISEVLLGQWSAGPEPTAVEQPTATDRIRHPGSVNIPVDAELPAVSEGFYPAQVIARRLQAPINTPAARAKLSEGLLVALPGAASSRAALTAASEEIAPRPPSTSSGAPRGAKRARTAGMNPHTHEVQRRRALVKSLGSPSPLPANVCDTLGSLLATHRLLWSEEGPLPSTPSTEWTDAERKRVLAVATLSLQRVQFEHELWLAAQADTARDNKRKEARKMWKEDKSGSLKAMTQAPPRPSTTSAEDLVTAVREQGRFVRLPDAVYPLYTPAPSEQWAIEDSLTDFKSAIAAGAPGDPEPSPVPSPLPPLEGFAVDWRASLTTTEYRRWLESAKNPLPAPLGGAAPTLPERAVDYKALEGLLMKSLEEAWDSGAGAWTERNAFRWTIQDPGVRSALRLDDLRFAGETPQCLVVTDGSGSGCDELTVCRGGFASLVISAEEVTVVLGYSPRTSAGQMELAAVLEGLTRAVSPLPAPATCASFSDYESWIKADLELHRASSAAALRYPHLWTTLMGVLETWGLDPLSQHHLYRHHTKAHVDLKGDWAQNLNQLCDALARIAKVWLSAKDNNQHMWHCPPLAAPWTPAEVKQLLEGPLTVGEWKHSLSTRHSKAADTAGSYYGLLRAGGTVLRDRMLDEFNSAAFRGQVPTYRADGTVYNKHRAIGKSSGGDRHLGAPDSAIGIFASILSTRLIRATLHMRSVNRAQKCNIPRISGCQENRHLFLASLYDLMLGARDRKYAPGKVRLFFLNDLSKAFDRAQHKVLLWALQILLGDACSTRFLAILDHMHTTARMVVTQQGVTFVISKEAGVIQGNPNSPPEFGCIMELVRRLIPPEQRPKVRFLCSPEELELRMEVDYADDQQRVTDSIEDMRACIGGLLHALRIAGLQWNSSKLMILALRVEPGGSLSYFDPALSVPDDAGGSIPIRALKEGELLTLYGVDLEVGGQRHPATAIRREMEVTQRIRQSSFPVPAKMVALRCVNSTKGEFAFFSAWTRPDVLQALDMLERKTMRSFVSLHLPNAYMMGELHLSHRVWRQEVIYLAGFIRLLGSKDPRVQLTALMMSRDAPRPASYGLGTELLSPRFFEWTGTFPEGYTGPPQSGHLLDTPERLCYLAASLKVGIWEEDGRIMISHEDGPVLHPHRLLQTLSRARDRHFLHYLEIRQSTNSKKPLAPEFALSWGTAGRPMSAQQRKEETAFMHSHSSYTDAEIRMVLSLRLLLWPTAFRASIYSGNKAPGGANCPCGMVQTATHLLNIPQDNTYHCEALRWLPHHRHTAGVACLVKALEKSGWRIIQAEGHHPVAEEGLEVFRRRIRVAVNRKWLCLPDGSTAQHHKADILLLHPETGAVYIVDVTFGSDDKLIAEQRLGELFERRWPPPTAGTAAATRMYATAADAERAIRAGTQSTMAHFVSESFDDEGALSDIKLTDALKNTGEEGNPAMMTDEERAQLQKSIKGVGFFKRARYGHRYTPLAAILADKAPACHRRRGQRPPRASQRLQPAVHLLVIAVGVAGTLPRFTERNLALLFDKEAEAKKVRQDLRHCAWRAAVECYRKWRAERA